MCKQVKMINTNLTHSVTRKNEKSNKIYLQSLRPSLVLFLGSHVFPFFPLAVIIFGTGTNALLLFARFTVLLTVRSQFDAVIRILVFYDGAHLETMLESASNVVGGLARFDGALDAGTHTFSTQDTDQCPPKQSIISIENCFSCKTILYNIQCILDSMLTPLLSYIT